MSTVKKNIIVVLAVLFIFPRAALAVTPTEILDYPSSFSLQGALRECSVVSDPTDITNTCIKLSRKPATGQSTDSTATWLEVNNTKKLIDYDIQGRFSLQFRMYLEENFACRIQLYGTKDNVSKEMISLSTNSSGAFNVGGNTLFAQCTPKKWHNIEIIVDTDDHFACFNINGERMFPIGNSSKLKFSTADTDNLTWFRFLIDANQFGKYILLDDIKLSSLSGIPSVADVSDILMYADNKVQNTLDHSAANTRLEVNLRVAQGSVPIIILGAEYDKDNHLNKVNQICATESGLYSIDLGKLSVETETLRCLIWKYDTLSPIDDRIFCRLETSAEKYGAIPNRGYDISAALRDALDNLDEGATLHIPEGEYILTPDYGEKYCLKLSGKKNINIVGDNAEFILADVFSGFMEIENCDGVNVSGIKVDYMTKPWEQGIVTEIDAENTTFVMQVSDNGGILDTETYKKNISSCFMTIRDSINPKLIDSESNEHYLVASVESLGDDLYRFDVNDWSAAVITNGILQINDKVIVNARGTSGSAFYIKTSSNVNIEDISVAATGECVIKGVQLLGDVCIDNVHAVPSEGRWISSNADGVHIQFSRGKVTLQNSSFDALLDDAVNLYQVPISIEEVSDKNIVVDSARIIEEGDTITVFNYADGIIRGEAAVSAVNGGNITIDAAIDGAAPGDVIYIKNAMFNNSLITNNQFKNLRRFGLLLKCSDIIVSNNRFENIGSDAVCARYSSSEGLWLRNAAFLNNEIINSGYLRNGKQSTSGAFSIRANENAQSYIHANIQFSGNTIHAASKCGFYLSGVNGAVIDGTNVLTNMPEESQAVTIHHCANITVDDTLQGE